MNVQVFKQYSHQGLCRAIDVYNYPWDYPSLTRILGYRFLFQWKHKEPVLIPKHEKVVESIKRMVLDNIDKSDPESRSVLMDIVDILLEFDKPTGEELLYYLRQAKLTANNFGATKDGTTCTIYSDSQSAHTPSLGKSVHKVVKYLCQNYMPSFDPPESKIEYIDNLENKLKLWLPGKEQLVAEVLLRIFCDNANFGGSGVKGANDGFQADQVLLSLWNWIHKNREHTKALCVRLTEELLEMHRYCSTRLVSGLVNVMQGFTDEEGLQVKMGDREQCKAVVYTYITKAVQQCEDEAVMEGFIDHNKAFVRFITNTVNKKRVDWIREYGDDFGDLINSVVNEYTGQNIFVE